MITLIVYVHGSASSEGTPFPGYDTDSSRKALIYSFERRKSNSYVFISKKESVILVDAGSSPLQDVVRLPDAVFISHWHNDHTQALTIIRWLPRKTPLYCPEDRESDSFNLIRKDPKNLEMRIMRPFDKVRVKDFRITSIPLNHVGVPTLGYVIEDGLNRVLYLCDTKGLPEETVEFLEKLPKSDVAIVDATLAETDDVSVPKKSYHKHNTLEEAIEIGSRFAERVYLTHFHPYAPSIISIHRYLRRRGIKNVFVAHDGLVIQP